MLELATGSRQNREDVALIHDLCLKEHHLLSQQNSSQLHAHLAAPRIPIREGYQLMAEEGNGSLHISAISSSSCCREAHSNQRDPFAQLQEQHRL